MDDYRADSADGSADVSPDVSADDLEYDTVEDSGLPEQLPPLRLPPDEELAATARQSAVMARVQELAVWVGDQREITDEGDLTPADTAAAAAALGIEVTGEPTLPEVPELVLLWDLAEAVDLVIVGDDAAAANPDLWPTGDDAEDLGTWAAACAALLASLALDGDLAGEEDLDFSSAGSFLLLMFIARSAGTLLTDVESATKDLVTEHLEDPDTAWDAWVAAHGHPANVLLDRLIPHGVVTVDDETAWLTPLGMWFVHGALTEDGIDIPLLPPPGELTAADLLAAVPGMTADEWQEELTDFLTTHERAELLTAAVAADPQGRVAAVTELGTVLDAADPAWQTALEHRELRPYAQDRLGIDGEPADLAWRLVDTIAATADVFGAYDPAVVEERVADLAGREYDVLAVAWRLPHPDTFDVLSLIGTHHPDKKLAKAARTAAHKAR